MERKIALMAMLYIRDSRDAICIIDLSQPQHFGRERRMLRRKKYNIVSNKLFCFFYTLFLYFIVSHPLVIGSQNHSTVLSSDNLGSFSDSRLR